MNFVERIFGLAPDGGAGSIEMLSIVLVAVIATAAFIVRRRLDQARVHARR